MLTVSWVEKMTNEVVLEKMMVKRELTNVIRACNGDLGGYFQRE